MIWNVHCSDELNESDACVFLGPRRFYHEYIFFISKRKTMFTKSINI